MISKEHNLWRLINAVSEVSASAHESQVSAVRCEPNDPDPPCLSLRASLPGLWIAKTGLSVVSRQIDQFPSLYD